MATCSPQLIRVSDEQVVLKRGVHELLISGSEAAEVAGLVVDRLRNASDADNLLAEFPESLRAAADQLLRTLRANRLVGDSDDEVAPAPSDLAQAADSSQWAFFGALDVAPGAMQARLRSATLAVVGVNLTSRSLIRSLLRAGLGTVWAVSHPVLDNHDAADSWDADFAEWAKARRLHGPSDTSTDAALGAADLAVAACDFGRAEALLEINGRAVTSGIPFLPVWLEQDAGFLGPLGIARETACLRCFADRRDGPGRAGSGPPFIAVQPREPVDPKTADASMRPFAAVCGCIAAMEALKFLTGCAPSGTVGRSVEVSSRTLALCARRVLKHPRCPDCSEIARHRVPAVMEGPQIPNR
jgi:bacteriocin biosynthesis cyclodehydratase domain-containing protein